MIIIRTTILVILSICCAGAAFADATRITLREPGRQTIPLALTRFLPLDGVERPDLAAEVAITLRSDFDLSGIFALIDSGTFLSDAGRIGLTSTAVDFSQWRLLRAESVIKGAYQLDGEELTLEARLYDVTGRRLLTGRRYRGRPQDARRMAHAFADLVLKSLSGRAGAFNTRLAFISDQTGYKELFLMETDGRDPIQITDHRSLVLNPDFSPLGREVIFTSYRDDNPDLYRKEIYTGFEAKISHRTGLNIAGRFRADGGELAVSLSHDGNSELYLLSPSGVLRKRLTDNWAIDVDPSWSPGGDRLAFVSDRRGNPHVFILDIPTGKVERLTFDGKYNVTPAWSPVGDRIAFSRLENGKFDIYTVRSDGGDERRLTDGPGNKEHPRWSPDGRFLVYSSDASGEKAIHVMRADGSGDRRLTPPGANYSHPAWSPRW